MKNEGKAENEKELNEIEEELAEKYAKEYLEKINVKIDGIDCEDGGLNSGYLWNLKKEIFPKSREPPTAMIDPTSGNLITSDDKIEEAAITVYKDRLKARQMNEDLKHIKDAKELLCDVKSC